MIGRNPSIRRFRSPVASGKIPITTQVFPPNGGTILGWSRDNIFKYNTSLLARNRSNFLPFRRLWLGSGWWNGHSHYQWRYQQRISNASSTVVIVRLCTTRFFTLWTLVTHHEFKQRDGELINHDMWTTRFEMP